MISFDICIPTWNSLDYLKLAVKGIQRNSSFKHEIIVHDNASTDGTQEWLLENNIRHTISGKNLGFCGVNHALRQSTADHVMVLNSDMYPLPEWDLEINKQLLYFKRIGLKQYTVSSCLIEPQGHNPEYDIDDFGSDAEHFDEERLLREFKIRRGRYYTRQNTVQYSHPILFPSDMLRRMGYFDMDYFPGWAVDHDIAARAYFRAECRHFVMLGRSRVYHFSSKTFQKLPEEIRARHGEDVFFNKWGRSVRSFRLMLGLTQPYVNRN